MHIGTVVGAGGNSGPDSDRIYGWIDPCVPSSIFSCNLLFSESPFMVMI